MSSSQFDGSNAAQCLTDNGKQANLNKFRFMITSPNDDCAQSCPEWEYYSCIRKTCSSTWALAMELRLSCTNPSMCAIAATSPYKRGMMEYYNDVIMGAIASQITSPTIVYSIVYSDADQRKHQSSVSPAFVRGIHRGPVNSPHKWPVTRKMFPFDDVIMSATNTHLWKNKYV